MILSKLTRFPGTGIPYQAVTGNPALDDFLIELDRHLLGSAKVRMQFLAEIKDHLLEKKDPLIEEGRTEDVAMTSAVQSMGTPDELAKSQREELKKKYIGISVPSGIIFGIFMALFSAFTHLKGKGLVLISLNGLQNGVFFGLFMGWFMTFIWPERQLTSALKTYLSSAEESEFVVHYSKWMRRLSYPITVFFLLMGVYCISFGIAGFFYISINKNLLFPRWMSLVLGGIAIIDFFAVRLCCRKYKVNEDGIYVDDFLGRKKIFAWKNLKRVGLLGDIRPWILRYWKKVKYAEFENGNHKAMRMLVYPDMVNADRLFVLLDKKANM